jgi:hypothetical protein
MVRTQVYFTEEQHLALRHAAEREGISMTALLRKLVERHLRGRTAAPDYSKDAIMSFADLGRSGRTDLSERHDEALAEALRGQSVR